MTEPDVTPSAWVAGDLAESDVYVIYSEYASVEDLDGSFVTIDMPYDKPRYATELLPGQRGNLVLAAGSVVTEEVAASLDGS